MNKKLIFLLFCVCYLFSFAYEEEDSIFIRNILRAKEYLELTNRKIDYSLEVEKTNDNSQFEIDEMKILPKKVMSYCDLEKEIKKGMCTHENDLIFDVWRAEKLNGLYLKENYSIVDYELYKFKKGKLYSIIREAEKSEYKDPTTLKIENFYNIKIKDQVYNIKTLEELEILIWYPNFTFEDYSLEDYMANVMFFHMEVEINEMPKEIIGQKELQEQYCRDILNYLIENNIKLEWYNQNLDYRIPYISISFYANNDKEFYKTFSFTYKEPEHPSWPLELIEE